MSKRSLVLIKVSIQSYGGILMIFRDCNGSGSGPFLWREVFFVRLKNLWVDLMHAVILLYFNMPLFSIIQSTTSYHNCSSLLMVFVGFYWCFILLVCHISGNSSYWSDHIALMDLNGTELFLGISENIQSVSDRVKILWISW